MIHLAWMGIDVSAEWFDACLKGGRGVFRERFPRTPEGCAACVAWVRSKTRRRVSACLEPTGGYERLVAEALREAGIEVSRPDGAAVRRYRESFGRRAKTDVLDAGLLADYARERRPAEWAALPPEYEELQSLARHRESLVKGETVWRNRSRAPVPCEFAQAQCEAMAQVHRAMREEAEKRMEALVREHPRLHGHLQLVCTIPGIGPTTAYKILGEIGPPERHWGPRSLARAAGLVPLAECSGKARPKSQTGPYGNRFLRSALRMGAATAKRTNPVFHAFARRVEGNGPKPPNLVTNAVMRKMIHIVWGVLHHQTPYDPEIVLSQSRLQPIKPELPKRKTRTKPPD